MSLHNIIMCTLLSHSFITLMQNIQQRILDFCADARDSHVTINHAQVQVPFFGIRTIKFALR